jgi:hypothetical protein
MDQEFKTSQKALYNDIAPYLKKVIAEQMMVSKMEQVQDEPMISTCILLISCLLW